MILTILQEEHYHMMDWWFDIFGPFAWVFMISGWIIYGIMSIAIAYFVHKDALRRGIKNSEFWLVIGLIFNLLGLILYLIVRNNYRTSA
ncbi:MAG: hypothetical protein ACFE96_18185 [Candidatus Hermodarchaeota archaeon]